MNWQKSVNSAKDKDILVNTIYCQNAENEDSRLWAEAAQRGNGSYFNINQNQKTDTLPTPYDQEIFQLNNQLNQTYLPYGSQGQAGQARQQVQDSNLASALNSQAAVSRAVSKSSDYYRNASWDLVDAVTERTVDLESLETAQLPKPIQGLSLEEKENYIQNMSKERKLIQGKIAELSAKRNNYINEHSSKTNPQNTLNAVMIEALRQQLKTKGFTLQ
jgi:hypothetical protein